MMKQESKTQPIIFFLILTAIFTAIFYKVVAYVDENDLTIARDPVVEEPIQSTPRSMEISATNDDTEEILTLFHAILGNDEENFSIYLYRPDLEEDPLMFRSRPMPPASMIKVFILAKLMQDVHDEKISLDDKIELKSSDLTSGSGVVNGYKIGTQIEIRKLAELMIAESDNTATNMIIDKIGIDEINKYLDENGYYDTQLNQKMMQVTRRGRLNSSSVEDLGTLFSRIYRHECVNPELDDLMVTFLLRQKDSECFPAALPNWRIAHKTGEIDRLYDDGGIFYGSDSDFILVIMNENYSGRAETIEKMQRIAKLIALNYMEKIHQD
ncbi:MAG: serine hydrolase [Selenomonadaceae bacterium]|nr:serine hydrolase [Selenomonadaceae bacterium]